MSFSKRPIGFQIGTTTFRLIEQLFADRAIAVPMAGGGAVIARIDGLSLKDALHGITLPERADPSLLLAVSDTLRAEGYEVQTARRGSEAMIRVAESLPDLIISDIRMPGMDGYALVRNLRASPRTRLVPIVFLTAKDETADRIAGFRSGVDAYVTKPSKLKNSLRS